MTNKEILLRFLEKLEEGWFDSEEFRDAENELHEVAELDYDSSPLVVECDVNYFIDGKDETIYLGALDAEKYNYYQHNLDPRWGMDNAHNEALQFCATEDLEAIQEEVKGQYEIVAKQYVAKNFLINPRKEVVKWALEHKDELGLNTVKREFIEKHQAIPELKELILNTLEKKGK